MSEYIASARPLHVFLGKCVPCVRPVRASSDTYMGDHYPATCPDCRKPVTCERLYGTVTKMDCNSACQGAYGPVCECGCGGINHGNVWSERGEMLADELAAYQADQARREAQRQTRRGRKAAAARAAFETWARDHLELVTELTGTDWMSGQYPNYFLADMSEIVSAGKPLTDNQATATGRTLTRRREAAQRQAEATAARAATATEVPAGRQVITGTIIAAWSYEGEWGWALKIKIDCGTYSVRGTCPRALLDTLPRDCGEYKDALKGRRVTLTAGLRPDGQEKGQGYFSRPAKAAYVTA